MLEKPTNPCCIQAQRETAWGIVDFLRELGTNFKDVAIEYLEQHLKELGKDRTMREKLAEWLFLNYNVADLEDWSALDGDYKLDWKGDAARLLHIVAEDLRERAKGYSVQGHDINIDSIHAVVSHAIHKIADEYDKES